MLGGDDKSLSSMVGKAIDLMFACGERALSEIQHGIRACIVFGPIDSLNSLRLYLWSPPTLFFP